MKYNLRAIKRFYEKEKKDLMEQAFFRNINKKTYNQKVGKPLLSLRDKERVYQKEDDYEAWTEYGFFEADKMTDEEIQECINDMWITVNSPYDCTGKEFTMWITWHRNPCGLISVIHRKGLDV